MEELITAWDAAFMAAGYVGGVSEEVRCRGPADPLPLKLLERVIITDDEVSEPCSVRSCVLRFGQTK